MFPPKKNLSKFAQAKQELQQGDEGIAAGVGTETGVGLSFEELRSQSTSQNNVSTQLLSTFIDKGERDKIEYENSQAKKEMERLAKEQAVQKDRVLSKVAEKNGIDKAIGLMDTASKLRKLEEKDIFTAYSKHADDFISSKGVNVAKPLMAIGGFFAHAYNDMFNDTRLGLTKAEQKEYDALSSQQRKELQPALTELKTQYQQEMEKANKRRKEATVAFTKSPEYVKWQNEQNGKLRKDLDSGPTESSDMDFNRRTAIKYEDLISQIDDYTSGNAGFWDGFGSQKKDVASLGLYSMGDSMIVANIKDKADRIYREKKLNNNNINYRPKERLTESEQALLEAEGHVQELSAKNLFENKLGYTWGQGVATSTVFMEATLATGGFGGAIESSVANAIVKESAKATLRQAWKQGGTKLLLSNLGAKSVGGLANVGVTSLLAPGTYTMAAKAKTGNMEFITDENGKQKLLVGQERYDHYKKDFSKKADLIQYDIDELEKKEKRSDKEEERLEGLKSSLQNITDEFDTLYKPNNWGESLWYGYSETVKENFSEKYVGAALPGLSNNMLMRNLAKTQIGGKIAKGITATTNDFAQSSLGKTLNAPIKGYNYTRNLVNNLSLGKLSGNAVAHTGKASLIHSLPGEVAEEIWNQFMPTYKQDYAEQLETLKDSSFYRDTIAQTLIQGVAFGGIGMVGRGRNYMNDKARLREMYKALDASITDDDVANNILMNTGGTIYSPLDYDHKIMQLRKENTTDSHTKADRLEQNKFTNLAAMAIRTGTVDSFKKNLEAIQNKPDVSLTTKQNIALATARIDGLMEVYNKHSEKDNFATIFNLSERKLANDQTVKVIDEELMKQKEGAKEDIDAFILRKGLKIDYDIDTLLTKEDFESPEQEKEYTNFIQALSEENLTRVNLFGGLLMEKAGFQMDNSELNKEINDQTSPEYEERVETKKGIEQVYEKTLQDYQNSIITSETSVFNYNNQLEETPELVDEAIDRVKKQYKGRVADSFFEEVANKRKSLIELEQIKNKQKLESDNLQALLAKRAQVMEDIDGPSSIAIVPDTATVIVLDDVAQSAHQSFVQASVDSLLDVFPVPATLPNPVSLPSVSDIDLNSFDTPNSLVVADSPNGFIVFNKDTNTPIEVINSGDNKGIAKPYATQEDAEKRIQELKTNSNSIVVSDSEFDLSIDTRATYSPQQLDAAKAFTKESVERIEERLGRKPTFREFAEQTYKYSADKKALRNLFPHMYRGWQENGYEATDFQEVFNDLFNPYEAAVTDYVKNMQNIFEQSLPIEEVSPYTEFQEQSQKVTEQVLNNNVTTIGYDEENMAIVQTAESEEELRKNINITPRIGYSAMSSTTVNNAGGIETVTVGTELAYKEGDLIDPRDLINPNLFPTGTKVSIEIADASLWDRVVATNGRDAQGNLMFTTFDKWVAEREKNNPNFRDTQEFRDKVPMFYTDGSGKRLGYVQEVDKFNAYTVKNPAGSSKNPAAAAQDPVWSNHIQKGIDNARALRDSIHNGLREVTLTRSAEASPIKIPDTQPKVTVREANPQATLVVQRGTDLHTTFDSKFEGKIIDRQLFRAGAGGTNGHTWMVSQIGTTTNNKGEVVPQYRAYPIQRVVSEDQVETARWALAAYMTLEGRTDIIKGSQFEMTREIAERIQADINKNMGYNIGNHLELVSFIKTFFQTAVQGDKIDSYKSVLFDEESYPDVRQHTNLKLFGNKKAKIVSIVNGKVISSDKNYEDYLKDTLETNLKAVNVGTEEKPVYAIVAQPTFTVSYTPVAQVSGPEQVETQQVETVELAKEIVAEPLNIDKHVELLSNLGISLDEFEVSDDMIEDTAKLANLFKTVGNLNILQEKAIRQFIVHNIGERVSLEYKSSVSKVKLKEDIKKDLDSVLGGLETQLKTLLTELDNSNSTDSKVALLKEAYATTLRNIKDIKGNFTSLFDKSFADIQKQTQLVEKETEETTNTDEETQNVKDYNKESIEESGKAKASYRLRRFLHKINKYDAKGVAQTTYLGLPSYMSFNDVYNELSKVLSMGSEVESNYDKLIEKLKQSEAPFVKDILAKLEGADQQIKNEFVYNFVRHTLSSKFGMYESGPNGVTLKMYNTNANEASRIINNKWKNDNMVSGLYKKDGTVDTAFADRMIEEFNSWDKDHTKVAQADLRNWLGKLGFTFQDAAWNQIYEKGIFNAQRDVPFKDLYNINAGGLFVPIVDFLTKAKNDPTGMKFDVNANVFSNLGGVTKALSAIETKYNPNLIALSFRDTGKNISTLVPTKYITDMVQNLKRASVDQSNTLIEDLQSLSFSEDSIILDLLQNVPAFKNMFQVHHVALTAIKEKGDTPTKSSLTDLSDIDFDMNSLAGFQDRKTDKLPAGTKIDGITMRMAHMLSPTMSDKSTGLYMETAVFDFMTDKSLLFKVEEDGSISGFKIQLKEMLFERLVLPELKRIIKFHREVGATNIKNYDKGAQLFHLLPIMNTLKAEDGVRIIEKLASPTLNYTLEEAVEEFGETFQNAIEAVVQQEVEHKKESWSGYTETKGGKTTSKMFDKNYFTEVGRDAAVDYDLAVNDFVLNNLLFNAEMFKVFAGDIASYSQDKLFTEQRLNKETNKEEKTKINAWDFSKDESYISINKQIGTNLGKRLALLIAPGNKIANSRDEEYNQIFLNDSIDITENAEYLIKNYYGEEALVKANPLLTKHAIAAKIVDRYEQGIVDISPELYVKAKSDMKEARESLSKEFADLSAYFDIESTDAQEYSTAAEHISILHRMGRLSDKELKTINDKLEKGEDLTKEELNVVFQPIKPVHTGTYINKEQDVNRVVYIKSSAFPLLPQLTAGTRLEGLRNKMEELEKNTGRFTRASFQTANKVGATVNGVNPFDTNSLSDIKEYAPNDAASKVLTLKRDNFRIQQDVPFKSDKAQDDKVSMGTQFFKLLFGDGMVDADNFEIDGKKLTGKELYQHYNTAFKDIVDSKKADLFFELGLDERGKVIDQNQFMVKLQDLLIKEATSRGYSVKSLAGLKLEQLQAKAGIYYEFKTPLWLSSDSNRYESLLNAIITNRIMKHKMPGNGFVAGSEAGFSFKENLEGIDRSRVIYLDNWNGKELQGTHTEEVDGTPVFKKAQVFVPSKFKGADKKLIDLFEGFNGKEGKYIIKRENGTLGLKEGMIDSALFNNFSFRTPTSSHVSGSSIEIAGILPPEVGDLMIVPKNFTKQKGLDYDIDKESAYQLNHVTTIDGKIQVLTKEYADAKINELKDKIEKANLQNLSASAKSNFAQELFRSFVQGSGSLLNEESLETLLLPQLSIASKLSRVETELKRKLAENEFIKTHLAVFNNPDSAVQNKINKVLSIDFASKQADLIEELTAEGIKNAAITKNREINPNLSLKEATEMYQKSLMNFTMLTNSYQKMKMDLGSIGKTAIGVYANYTTFNGLLQQNISGKDVFIMDENGDPKITTIGNFISNGFLGTQKTLLPTTNSSTWASKYQRTTAEVFAEKENTATDNEKEQILGRVGVNEDTINVDAYLSLLGFDRDELGNSISYMLLSQPAIRQFNGQKKASKGILGEFLKQDELIAETVSRLSEGAISYKQVGEGSSLKYHFVDTTTGQIAQPDGRLLTGANLLEGVKYSGEDAKVQLNSFMTYIQIEKEARAVSTVQKTINANTLGKSMIESQLKFEALKNLPNNGTVKGVENLIGEFTKVQEGRQDGEWMGEYYVTPTTPQGQIVINGLRLGNTMYQDFFPYQEQSIVDTVKEILAVQGKGEVSDAVVIENFEEIVENIKKYIYSRQGNNVFEMDPRAKRFELFKDTDTNTSLSTYMKDLVGSKNPEFAKGIRVLSQNPLVRSFTYESSLGETDFSVIKYNNAATDNLDEEELYNSIPELILMDAPLPPKNGKEYSTKMLAEDLVSYSFLQGGVQKATEFVKYVPVEYLETVGTYETQKEFVNGEVVEKQVFVPANKKLQGFNSKKNKDIDIFGIALGVNSEGPSTFTKQYFQHNPNKAPKVPYKERNKEVNGLFKYTDNAGKSPSFVSIKNKKGDAQVYSLYENIGNGMYQKIDTLGNKGVNEYEYRNPNVSAMNSTTVNNTPKVSETQVKESNGVPFNIVEGTTTVRELTQNIADAVLSPEYAHLSEAANWLLPIIKNGTQKVIVDKTLSAAGRASRQSLNISINPIHTTEVSADKTALVFIHELIHTVSAKEVTNYYQADGVTLRTDVPIPAHVEKLDKVFRKFTEAYKDEITELQNKRNSTDESLGAGYTEREKEVIYAGINIREFMTVAMTSPTFQKELSEIPSGESNLWEDIKAIFMDIIESIYPGIKNNSLAKDAIVASMNLINEESKGRRVVTQDVIPADVHLILQQEEANKLMYGNPTSIDLSSPDNDVRDENTVDLSISDTEKNDTFVKEDKSACEGGLAI